jgi:tyrosyl-tRNA synthetase
MQGSFLNELKWRGLTKDLTDGTEPMFGKAEQAKVPLVGYIGFDPTADSLHVGNLVQIATLRLFQRCGHKPIALIGGATGMVGDPSGKKSERPLLGEEELRHNQSSIGRQLERFLDFGKGPDAAEVVNNYDWFKDMGFLNFIREAGKHLTVNYMLAKDSVKDRLETGLSFTEFSYQLVQGYDFYYLWKHKGCQLQMGGSDQWGNITTGTELIRRMGGDRALHFPANAITTKLLTKADGSKFGKSESGNVWLDAQRTSPYRFHQFWRNASDEDAHSCAFIFLPGTQEEMEQVFVEHRKAPHVSTLQKELANYMTTLVHGQKAMQDAKTASDVLFGNAPMAALAQLGDAQWTDIFEGVPQGEVPRTELEQGMSLVELLSEGSGFLPSKGEAKRALREGGISINKAKAPEDYTVGSKDLVGGRFVLLQRGKKNYFLVKAV